LATFKERLPAKRELVLVFAACAFPIYSWAIFQFLDRMTGWLYYLSLWEVLSILAYALTFALFETVVIFVGLTLLAWALPAPLFRRDFVAVGMVAIILASTSAIFVHYQEQALRGLSRPLLLGIALVLGVVALGIYMWVRRSERVAAIFRDLTERLSLFLYIYVPLSLVSIVVVVMRNFL
jgi:hypothetical protein